MLHTSVKNISGVRNHGQNYVALSPSISLALLVWGGGGVVRMFFGADTTFSEISTNETLSGTFTAGTLRVQNCIKFIINKTRTTCYCNKLT